MRSPGGGALQLHLYGGVWPQDWKIDPSADETWPKNRPILRLFAIKIDQTTADFIQFRGKSPIPR